MKTKMCDDEPFDYFIDKLYELEKDEKFRESLNHAIEQIDRFHPRIKKIILALHERFDWRDKWNKMTWKEKQEAIK